METGLDDACDASRSWGQIELRCRGRGGRVRKQKQRMRFSGRLADRPTDRAEVRGALLLASTMYVTLDYTVNERRLVPNRSGEA